MFFHFGLLRKAVMAPPPELATADYSVSGRTRQGTATHLDRICQVFVHAMGSALELPTLWQARFVRDTIDAPYRGFAVEGIAMGLTLAELTSPFSQAVKAPVFAEDFEGRHRLLAYVGIGMALARLNLHPKLRWSQLRIDSREFMLDGYGFARGFFRRKKYVEHRKTPRQLSERELRMFDQGLGRVIWITSENDIERVAKIVRTFAIERQRALWGGVGIACTYSGSCDHAGYEVLKQLAGDHHAALARGCAAACYQRALDQYIPSHAEAAANVFWNASVLDVAERFTCCLQDSGNGSSELPPVFRVYEQLERDALAPVRSKSPQRQAHST